jgi:asparagine synthase (glutamine-hydrolysing)
MCGIGGCVVPPGERPPRDRLESMRAALGHRGPDASGLVIEGNVGLVHTRLAIIDPTPRGEQPMRHPGGRWLLSYNGEVFNHLELRGLIGDAGFEGGCDTETVLRSLAKWGEAAVPRFNGLFAFAALDLDAHRLLLVRDRFGVKPLYVAMVEGSFFFASEIGALLAAGVPRRPAPEVIADAIEHVFPNGRRTPIEGIERVPPGSIVSLDLRSLERNVAGWYDPVQAVDVDLQAELERQPRHALVRMVDKELRRSVHRRLMADVPIGTMCSGGLDSSLVTAFAREARPDIVAFNVATPGDRFRGEGPAAARVTDALGINLETVEMTPASWRSSLVAAVRHFEYPLANASAPAIAQMAALARARGVKVLLTGEAADELAGGYWSHHRKALGEFLPYRHNLGQMLDWVRAFGPRETIRAAARRMVRPQPRVLLTSDDGGRVAPDLLERARAAYGHHSGPRRELEAQLLCDLSVTLPHLLNRMDKNAMQASVEARTPFLDPGFVALMLNLPLEARVGPRSKGILRDVARSQLPRSTARRPKVYGMRIDPRWITDAAAPSFLRDGCLRELLEVPIEKWTDLGARLPHRLWSAEVWCRLMLEGQSVADVERELWPSGP